MNAALVLFFFLFMKSSEAPLGRATDDDDELQRPTPTLQS
jgi:hypothetical protein